MLEIQNTSLGLLCGSGIRGLRHLFLDGAGGEEAVKVTFLLLAVTPTPRRRLLVVEFRV